MSTSFLNRFNKSERRCLLSERGIGELVVERLESVGLSSLAQLRQVGVTNAVLMVCASVGSIAWANRRRPLERALLRSMTQSPVQTHRTTDLEDDTDDAQGSSRANPAPEQTPPRSEAKMPAVVNPH